MAFQKRDGTYFLALWLSRPSYDPARQKPITVPEQNVVVVLPRPMRHARTHRWQPRRLAGDNTIVDCHNDDTRQRGRFVDDDRGGAMKELREESLSKHTSLRIGGSARRMLIPESQDELIAVVREASRNQHPYFVLGRGSNVLATDEPIETLIIKNTNACRSMSMLDNGQIEVGSSVELQRFIRFCVERDLEGMEYLQSVPGNIGGAVYMNAGRGKHSGEAVSDCLVSVDAFDGERVVRLTKAQCQFSYRHSIFRRKNWIILSARFAPPPQPRDVGLRRISERMAYVREAQDNRLPNAGTVFAHRFRLGSQLMGHRVNDAQFSTKTTNWILNIGHATCRDVLRLIRHARLQHVMRAHLPPQLEWIHLA